MMDYVPNSTQRLDDSWRDRVVKEELGAGTRLEYGERDCEGKHIQCIIRLSEVRPLQV
eukprot:SAG11_NODE_3700_length_2271_cov_1.607274_1_plen_58_part_00